MTESVYCGPPPLPSNLWTSWNTDAWLLLALLTLALGIAVSGPPSRQARVALGGAVVALLTAFVSPLCALTTALFSARVTHHILTITLAAPLLALAAPHWRLPTGVPLTAITLTHALLLWFWHAPAPYAWALSGMTAYWFMEISLMLSAFWLWSEILAPDNRPAGVLAALFGTIVQMGLLGAIVTFARVPLYDLHAGTTTPFGLTQLEDQQLAGLIMWIPAAVPYLVAAGFILWRLLPQEAGEARERDA
jgi:putative membrane protein